MLKKMNSELARLIYDFNWDEITAFNVYSIRKKLTATWFEYYIKFFFEKILKYKMFIPSKTYAADWGIDIKWMRINKDGIKEYCIVQCKRHSSTTFGVVDLRAFVWWIFHTLLEFPTAKAYFIITSNFTTPARKFASEEWISLKDYSNIANICKRYSLSEFEKDINKELPWKYSQLFNKWIKNKETKAQWKLFSSVEDELLKTLKNIRYSIMQKRKIYDSSIVTETKVLEYLSRVRPHNLDALKSALYESDLPKEDVKISLNYADEYIKGMLMYA